MSDRMERLRALVTRALHPKTPEEEARTSAMQACRLVKELHLLDGDARPVRKTQARSPQESELDRDVILKLGPDRGGRRRMHVLLEQMAKVTACGETIPATGVLESRGEPGWGPRMTVRIPYWYSGPDDWQRRISSYCWEASGPWAYAQKCEGCWAAWCQLQVV